MGDFVAVLKSIECFKNAEDLGLSNRLFSLVVVVCYLLSGICASRSTFAQAVANKEPTTDSIETVLKAQQPFVIGFERFGRHGDLTELDSGRLLLSELGCVSCHTSNDVGVQPAGAPDLSDAGHRLQRGWVNEFLSNPHGHSPGTRMPDPFWMLQPKERRATVEAISAFLTSQQQAVSLPRANGAAPVLHEFWEKGNSEVGRDLYHGVGCVACHSPDPEFEASTPPDSAIEQLLEQLEPEEIEELGLTRQVRAVPSMPAFVPSQSNGGQTNDLAAKYTLQSLTLFLLDPHRVRPSARMPTLRLTPSEAADLAAYLIQGDASVSAIADQSDEQFRSLEEQIKIGAVAFANYGCVRCHQANGVDARFTGEPDSTSIPTQNSIPTKAPKPLAKLSLDTAASCIESPAAGMPAYLLDAEQKRVVRAAIKQLQLGAKEIATNGVARNVKDVQHRVWMQMVRYNCVACHERQFVEDGPVLGGIGRYRKPFFETTAKVDIGDEGRLPPSLTGVGAKLSSSGLKSVFGVKSIPHRPFMTIRMPSYHDASVASLVEDLPRADQKDSRDADDVFVASSQVSKKELQSVGRELINTGCVECHVFREEQLPGAVGVDLHAIDKRVQPSWFREFIENPGALKSRTRMPTFFPDGKSNRPDLLGGNVEQQIAAIWTYLQSTDPLPEKITEAMSKDFELIPSDRPEVVRTFMKDVGTHAIAVGFSQGLHYAFDSEAVRLASLWKGRFLDARGTWFERFVPMTSPLGESRILVPGDSIFFSRTASGLKSRQSEVIFKGYRLDSQGVPTLLYRIGQWLVEDRFEPLNESAKDSPSLLRRMRMLPDQSIDKTTAQGAVDRSKSNDSPLSVLILESEKLDGNGGSAYQTSSGLSVQVRHASGALEKGSFVVDGTGDDLVERWLMDLDPSSEQLLEVIYQWK